MFTDGYVRMITQRTAVLLMGPVLLGVRDQSARRNRPLNSGQFHESEIGRSLWQPVNAQSLKLVEEAATDFVEENVT